MRSRVLSKWKFRKRGHLGQIQPSKCHEGPEEGETPVCSELEAALRAGDEMNSSTRATSVASRGKDVGVACGSRYALEGGLDHAYTQPCAQEAAWLLAGGEH